MTPVSATTLNGIRWHFTTCPDCKGAGMLNKSRSWHNDVMEYRVECALCRGFGRLRTMGDIRNPTRSGITRKVLA